MQVRASHAQRNLYYISLVQVVNVHWLAFQGQPTGCAAGIVEIPFWTSGTSHVDIAFPSVSRSVMFNILVYCVRWIGPLSHKQKS